MVAALVKVGYVVDRQRGSHIVLRHVVAPHRRLVVPDHKELATGTLRETGRTYRGRIHSVLVSPALADGDGYCAALLIRER